MKKTVLVVLAVLISSIAYSQSGWYQVTDTSADKYVAAIQFTSANTGYATTTYGFPGEFLKTTNGGLNWQSTLFPLKVIDDLYFIDSNTGFLLSWYFGYSSILKTTNAGVNWIKKDSIVQGFFVKFYDSNTGFVIAKYSQVRKTTNGGENWILQTGVNWGEPSTLICIDANTWLVASYTNLLNKTTNGGINWNVLNFSSIGLESQALYFINSTTGFSASHYGKIFKTTNTGENWFQISTIDSFTTEGNIQFINENTGYLCGGRYGYGVCKTTNGGYNWIKQVTNPNTGLFAIYFFNANTGFVGGMNRLIFRTTNGGSVFVSNITSEVPEKYVLGQNYPNPFNSTSNLKFQIVNTGDVKLVVYDLMGREVQTLVNERMQPGVYEVSFDGSMLTSGVYFYRLSADGFSETRKMVLLK
jgi:photosystem II stability/assembly factor-like uncharacterized protein